MEDGSFDYHTIGKTNIVEFNKSVEWVGVRQRFFNTFLIAKNKFAGERWSGVCPKATAILFRSQLPI
ncbi:hypothetical protein LWM68_32495 [Niabella sp. W65]|nr:hypothetical protein [Niabella sp. W65]MCH7367069.1 hypothetical protein [Niabella sp. W65]